MNEPKLTIKSLPSDFYQLHFAELKSPKDPFNKLLRDVGSCANVTNPYCFSLFPPSKRSKRWSIHYMKARGEKLILDYTSYKRIEL